MWDRFPFRVQRRPIGSPYAVACVVGAIAVGLLVAEEPDSALVSLVKAEKEFARSCAASGIRSAFLENLADGSIVFRPAPVDARSWFSDRPAPPGLLTWEPRFAEISRSGEFGYTTGPWEFRRDAAATDPDSVGHYVSVWRRQADGSWRLLIDVGTTHAPQPAESSELSFHQPAQSVAEPPDAPGEPSAKSTLLDAERRFSELALEQSTQSAYLNRATEDVRFYLRDVPPISGRQAVSAALQGQAGALVTEPLAAEIAASGDLGFTYGSFEFRSITRVESASPVGYYLRIWRRAKGGDWKLALDFVHAADPGEKNS
jgi:ketosteroid isomerase-like protein